jgi:hypothetical protein
MDESIRNHLGGRTVSDGANAPITGHFTCRRRLARTIKAMNTERAWANTPGIVRILFKSVKRTFGINVKVTN